MFARDGKVTINVMKIFRRLYAFFTSLKTLPNLNILKKVAWAPRFWPKAFITIICKYVPSSIVKSNMFQPSLKYYLPKVINLKIASKVKTAVNA